MKCIILPEENKKDYTDLPKFITNGLEVHFVSTYEDIYKIVFEESLPESTSTTQPFQQPTLNLSPPPKAKIVWDCAVIILHYYSIIFVDLFILI